jgi:NAD(P)-dependent dehydrogenase (short-subunit alcohol dehydrogenase family)
VTAVVTGASRGIGRATAVALAERGIRLALVGHANDAMESTAQEVRRRGGTAEIVPCDLANSSEVTAAGRQVLRTLGAPSIVVNNAGVIHRTSIDATTDEAWNEQLDVNLRAPFQLTRAFLPAMKAAKKGRFVHVASISATLGAKNAAAYSASKWGLVGFMKSLAEELSDTGLMTMAILPGSVDTQMLEGSGFSARMTAADVAKTIAYYSLDAPLSHNGGVVEMFGV